jgi:hypothetical protein
MIEAILVLNWSGKVRKEVRNGRTYYVAKATLIVPGVLNGSQGALFYPPEEVAREPETWNGMPIVLYHPEGSDQMGNLYHMSARDPDVAERYQIGTVYHATINEENGALESEAWFDSYLLGKVQGGSVVLQMLSSGKPIGLSTGLFTTNYPADSGSVYNSPVKGEVPYTHVARNYRPDHLAVLPDIPGACSIEEGCGINVNEDYMLKSKLRQALVLPGTDAWIIDAKDGVVIFKQNGQTLKQTYTIEGAGTTMEKIVLGDREPAIVKQVGTYYRRASLVPNEAARAIDQTQPTHTLILTEPAEVYMYDRKRAIAYLTANCKCWQGTDAKAFLEKASDDLVKEQVGLTHNAKSLVVNADTVDWGKLAKMIGVDIDPKTDPVAFVTAMQTALSDIQGKLSGETPTEVETPEEASTDVIPDGPVAAEDTPTADLTEEEKAAMATNLLAGKPLPKLKRKAPVSNKKTQPTSAPTAQAWLAAAPPEIQSVVLNAIKAERTRKNALVAQLTANIHNAQAKVSAQAVYAKMGVQELEALAAALPVPTRNAQDSLYDLLGDGGNPQPTQPSRPFFGGQGDEPVLTNSGDDDDVLPMPELYPAGYKRAAR